MRGSGMTIIAGVFSRNKELIVPNSICEKLRQIISRNPEDPRTEFNGPRVFLIKINIGAFDGNACSITPAHSVCMMAGEPLLVECGDPETKTRDYDLERIHDCLDKMELDVLRSTSGTFCASHYNPGSGTLSLIADRLALRPIYYAASQDYFFFASALRILEDLPEIPKRMDLRAVAEIAGFGYPFDNGTPYADIRVLRPCEVVQVSSKKIESHRYFDWDSVPISSEPEQQLLIKTYEHFDAAVRRRLRKDKTTFGYLSGGLDSRCTVAALRMNGTHVYTFNFSLTGTQDQQFGLDFAKNIGTVHVEKPTEPWPDWSMLMSKTWTGQMSQISPKPEHPKLAWTGEGGSVGLGHVYLTPDIIRLLRTEDIDGAIGVFLEEQKKAILMRLLKPKVAAALDGHLHDQLRRELNNIDHPDLVRRLYIFLNLNGPRHHLAHHFESIDQHRLEFQVPFYDSHFLEFLTSIKPEPCLYHEFYVKWLSFFDSSVLSVPWQAYPGHVPSIAPIPRNLPNQWQLPATVKHRTIQRRELVKRTHEILGSQDFPGWLLRKNYLRCANWLYQCKLSDSSYPLRTADTYYRYWHACQGKYEFS